MSKGWVAGCPQLLAPGGSPAACTGGSSPSQGNAAHATWWQCPGAALVQATTTSMESLRAPTAAPAGPAALGDTVGFSLRQAHRLASYAELVKVPGAPRSLVGFRSFLFSSLSVSFLARKAMSPPESTRPATARAEPLL